MKKIIDGALLIAIFTAFLFCSSYAYQNAYFNAMGIESGFIEKNPYSLMFQSAILLFEPVAVAFIILFILLTVLSLTLEFLRMKNRRKPYKTTSIKLSKKNGIEYRKVSEKVEKNNPFDSLLNVVVSVFILVCSFYALLVYCESKAKDDVHNTVEKIKLCNLNESSLIYSKNYKNPLYIITCGTNNCAAIDIEQPRSCRNWLNKDNKLKIIYLENKTEINNFYNYAK